MRRILVLMIVCMASLQLTAQNTGTDLCSAVTQLSKLAHDKKLLTLKQQPFTSKYYAASHLFASSVTLPGTTENFIQDDGASGSFHCIAKDFGDDEQSAKDAFDKLTEQMQNCLPDGEVSVINRTKVYINYMDVQFTLQCFQSGNANNHWIIKIKLDMAE